MTTQIVIVAGGRGLRLRALTDHEPKPMISIGAKPMLHTIIERYAAHGFKRFWLCLGYKASLIEAYFGNGSSLGVKIRYVHETEPLGTGGPLMLIPKFDTPYIVCNADVLCDLSPGLLMEAHARSGASLTMCVWRYEHQIRYGVATIEETGRLTKLEEKPVAQWTINAGIYVLSPGALQMAPKGPYWDMPTLIDRITDVNTYAIEGDWHDVGTLEDLSRARQEVE